MISTDHCHLTLLAEKKLTAEKVLLAAVVEVFLRGEDRVTQRLGMGSPRGMSERGRRYAFGSPANQERAGFCCELRHDPIGYPVTGLSDRGFAL